jgi:DNA-binding NtrC family response regulator
MNKDIVGVAPEALAMLQEYDWPGNVRELQHAVERAVILSPERVLQVHAFDGVRFGLSRSATGPTRPRSHALAEGKDAPVQLPPGAVVLTSLNVDAAEQQLIAHALDVSAGNRTRAAELLGISIRTLRSKLNRPGEDVSTVAD